MFFLTRLRTFLNPPVRRRVEKSSFRSIETLELLENRILLSGDAFEAADEPQTVLISEDFETPFNSVIRFDIAVVIFTHHFTQPDDHAPETEVQNFTAATRNSLDRFVDQLSAASDGVLQATYSLNFSPRVFTEQDYDPYDLGNGGQWLILKPDVIDSMKSFDFSVADAYMACVMWGPNATVGTANFYHGSDFISIVSPTQGVVTHEVMHFLDDKLTAAGEPGMVHADDLGDLTKYPLITTAETIGPWGLDWEGVPLIRNMLTFHDRGDGSTLNLNLLAGSLGESAHGFSLNGSAYLTGNELQLTNAEWQRGSVWFDSLLPTTNFTGRFSFQITQPGGLGWGDGFTFALVDPSVTGSTAIGEIGSGLGYAGLSGISVEFDTYAGWGELGYMHVGLNVNGSVESIQISELPVSITDTWLTAEISVKDDLLTVTLTAPNGLVVVVLTSTVPPGSLPAYSRVGFTAATGSAFQRVVIDGVSLSSRPESTDPQLLIGGPPAIFTRRQREVKILPDVIVESTDNWRGGLIQLTMNLAGKRKAIFDQISLPSSDALGIGATERLHQNEWSFVVQFNESASNASIQAFLREITFTTARGGLKSAFRTFRVSIIDSNFTEAQLSQMFLVKKRSGTSRQDNARDERFTRRSN